MKGHRQQGSSVNRRWKLFAALGVLMLALAFFLLRPVDTYGEPQTECLPAQQTLCMPRTYPAGQLLVRYVQAAAARPDASHRGRELQRVLQAAPAEAGACSQGHAR